MDQFWFSHVLSIFLSITTLGYQPSSIDKVFYLMAKIAVFLQTNVRAIIVKALSWILLRTQQ